MSYRCPQCGDETETLHEGYCEFCCHENQEQLDHHNAGYDRWQSLTGQQREDAIKRAMS